MANLADRIKSIVDSLRIPAFGRGPQEESAHGLGIFVSILAAILIWFMISMQESYTVVRDFPIEFVGIPGDTAFVERPPSTVRARVEGAGWQLLKLYTTTSRIQIPAGDGPIDVAAATSRSLAPELATQSVSPTQVTLHLEERTTRDLPIRLRKSVETVPPFDLVRQIEIEPDSVEVSGAASVLSRLEYWPTEVLNMEDVNTSFTTTVPLADTLEGLVRRSRTAVTVFGNVAEFTENRRTLDVFVTDAPVGEQRFRLIPDQVEVRYRVPIGQFEASVASDSFYATVSYSDVIADTTGRVSPSVNVPSDIVVKDLVIETPRLQYYVVLE